MENHTFWDQCSDACGFCVNERAKRAELAFMLRDPHDEVRQFAQALARADMAIDRAKQARLNALRMLGYLD